MKLKKGDVIYRCFHHDKPQGVYVIGRVTKTLAISGKERFKIDASGTGYVTHSKRCYGFSTVSYWLETEELKRDLRKSKAVSKLDCTKFEELDVEILEQMIRVMEN